MPDHFTFEEASQPQAATGGAKTFSFEEAQQPADTLAAPKPDFSIPTPSGLTSPPQRIGGLDMSKMGQDNKLPTPGVGGQAWETLWKAPKPMEDIVDVERGSRQQQRESDTKLRAMATKAGLNPDDFAKAPGAAELVLQGSADELVDLSKMALSPGGVLTAELGTATKIPAALKRIVSLAFAAQMLKQTPEAAGAFMDEMKKPPAERDYVKIGQTGAGTVASAVLGTMGLKAGVSPSKSGPIGEAILSGKVKPFQEPPTSGSALKMPAGAIPPQVPTHGLIPFKGIPDELLQDKPPKVTVPGTAAEPRETVTQTIQKAGAKTIGQIQALFPKANLSREQARQFRNQAWGTPEAPPLSQPEVEAQKTTPAQEGVKTGQMTKAESDELSALREKDLSEDGLAKDEEQRMYELSRKETQSKRAAQTSKLAAQLKEQGIEIPDSFLHPSDGVENHIHSLTWDPRNGMIQIRVERHTDASMSPRLITVKSGDVLTDGMDDSKVGTTRYREANPDSALRAGEKPQTPPGANPGTSKLSPAVRQSTPQSLGGKDTTPQPATQVPRFGKVDVKTSGSVSRIRYFDKDGNEVGYGQLDGDVINYVSVDPKYQRQGYGSEIVKDLKQRGGKIGVAGTPEGTALMRSKKVGANEYEPNKFNFEKPNPPPSPSSKPVQAQEGGKEEQAAIKQQGVTTVPESMAFITSDGRFIDSSGKNQGSSSEGRNIDHRQIAVAALDVADKSKGISGGDALRLYMDKTGNARINVTPKEVSVDIGKPLNSAQLKALATISKGKKIFADITKPNGVVEKSGEFKTFSDYKKWHDDAFKQKPSPAPVDAKPKLGDEFAQGKRGWDLIDEAQGNFKRGIDPKLIKESNPNWKPTGAARQLFRKGGTPADIAAQQLSESGHYKGDPGQVEQFGDEMNQVAGGRIANRKGTSTEKRVLSEQEAQTIKFEQDIRRGGKTKESVVPDDLNEGDEFTLNGKKLKVTKLDYDQDGNVTGLTLDDGKTYGTQYHDGQTLLKVDAGSVKKTGKEDLTFEKPESVDEQKAREAQETAAKLKKSQADELAKRAQKPLVGSVGDIGQTDMLGGGDLLSQPLKQPPSSPKGEQTPKPGKIEPKPVQPEKVQSPIEVLNTAKQVKITAPKGATMIRATTTDGKVSVQSLANVQGENIFRGANISKIEAGTIGKDKKFVPMEGEVKVEPKTHIAGYGGSSRESIPSPETPEQLVEVQKAYTPGLDVAGTKTGLQSLLLPTAKSPEHLRAAEDLGAKLGAMHHRAEAASAQLKLGSKLFDKLGVHNERLEPGKNPGIKFMSDMSQGRPMAGKFEAISNLIEKLFAERVQKLEEAGAPLQTVRDNYFPGMWTRESRLAFNAAMEKAKLPEGFDVNTATPEQKAAIKADVDKFLADGKGSDKDMLSFFTRSPMKGKESFRKKKVFEDIMTGAEFGLRPISYNPIDLVKGKLAEMDKSIMANEFFQQQKAKGKLEVIDPYTQVPDGWVKINDKYGTIYGGPTVKVPEFVDERVYDGLLGVADKLGVKHTRKIGIGGTRLGYSVQGGSAITTRFATETSVLAHELGHQIDYKYGLWDDLTGGGRGNAKGYPQDELRAVADIMVGKRGGKGYTHKKEEKIAQMIEAYVHAPDEMQKVAPRLFKWFDDFVKNRPELKPLSEIAPGIKLKAMTSEKYVGLPIMGYRIVPEATGDIINNYLSSSLYNNKYFGGLYKGWMAAANTLNQSQLGMGSAFHAGFTTGDVQISAGANLIKDIYGVARGNRSPAQLVDTAKAWVASSVKTAMTGNKVLNAWRNPDGVIDPHIAEVVKAAELAGGGFKMEHGLMTEQSTKVMRDWYSGSRIKAAARSPIALTELMAKPIMEYLVPRQKAGVFAELAWRIIEQNPGKPLEELTPQFRQAWNRVDSRLGQVRYNRLFANNTAKNVVQGLARAPGWTAGTIAEIGGAFPDSARFVKEWVKTGKLPADVPDRVAYTMSLLMTIGVINGALTYAFTGQMPRNMDFFAFRTGKKDQYGNDERFLMPSYMKDVLAYATHPLTTISNKVHPATQLLDDVLIKNHDYYGTEIRDPNASYLTQAGQTGKYVVKNFEPFWTRGARNALQQGSGVGRFIAPYFGIMPAPSYITRTKIQSEIADIYERRFGGGTKPLSKQAELQIKGEIRQAIKNGDKQKADELSKQALESGTLTQGQESALFRTANVPGDVFMWKRLDKSDKAALWAKMNAEEKLRYPMQPAGQTSNLP